MSARPYGEVSVAGPPPINGVEEHQDTLRDYVRRGIKQGWGNEHICKVVGVPPEIVDKERAFLRNLSQ
jgi:hypothetical protein